ncbi:hypothetical protein ANTRET_LOCUS7459 [Anthophora retusa]
MEFELDGSLKEWVKDKPLSILQLDPADRAVLRIAAGYVPKFSKSCYILRLPPFVFVRSPRLQACIIISTRI